MHPEGCVWKFAQFVWIEQDHATSDSEYVCQLTIVAQLLRVWAQSALRQYDQGSLTWCHRYRQCRCTVCNIINHTILCSLELLAIWWIVKWRKYWVIILTNEGGAFTAAWFLIARFLKSPKVPYDWEATVYSIARRKRIVLSNLEKSETSEDSLGW